MKLFSFGKENHEGDLVAIFDIGSASVGGALVAYPKKGKPVVFYTTRAEMPIEEDLDPGNLRFFMRKALDESARRIADEGIAGLHETAYAGSAPQHAYTVLGAPWYALHVHTTHRSADTPFEVTESHIHDLIEESTRAFQEDEQVKELVGDAEVTQLEKHATSIALNGYETSKPVGKEAKTIEAATVMSVAPRRIVDTIKEVIESTLPIEPDHMSFHSFPVALFDTVRDLVTDGGEHFLGIDVSGELTDVIAVRDGAIKHVGSFPVGKRTLLREVAHALNTTTDEALTIMRAEAEKALDKETPKKTQRAIKKAKELWVKQLVETLERMDDEAALPYMVYLTADDNAEPIFAGLLGHDAFKQFTLTDATFKVNTLRGELAGGNALHRAVVHADEHIKRDIFLMTETVFVTKL